MRATSWTAPRSPSPISRTSTPIASVEYGFMVTSSGVTGPYPTRPEPGWLGVAQGSTVAAWRNSSVSPRSEHLPLRRRRVLYCVARDDGCPLAGGSPAQFDESVLHHL